MWPSHYRHLHISGLMPFHPFDLGLCGIIMHAAGFGDAFALMNGWIDGWVVGWMDGWLDEQRVPPIRHALLCGNLIRIVVCLSASLKRIHSSRWVLLEAHCHGTHHLSWEKFIRHEWDGGTVQHFVGVLAFLCACYYRYESRCKGDSHRDDSERKQVFRGSTNWLKVDGVVVGEAVRFLALLHNVCCVDGAEALSDNALREDRETETW